MRGSRGGSLPDKNYIMGYSEAFVGLLRRRNADINAAYLLPYLKPGHRVLDFGCGPGTISVGLAKAVEPGELHGIDMEASQIEIARPPPRPGGTTTPSFTPDRSPACPLPTIRSTWPTATPCCSTCPILRVLWLR